MLNHGITLRTKNCILRPTLETDEKKIIELWNQPFVVGNLYMSKTSPEVYEKYFKEYKIDPYQYRWTIENCSGNFVGTDSLTISEDGKSATSGHFAMYPTETFLNITPSVLIHNWAFNEKNIEEIRFTVLETNKNIIKFHKILKAEFTGKTTKKVASNGEEIVLQHWRYTKDVWARNADKFLRWIEA